MRYSGILAKKIPWAGPRGATLLTATEADARTDAELDKRMAALFRHYGLEPGDAWNLAVELAFAHVPGFAFEDPPKEGAKRNPGRPLGKVAAGTPSYRKVFRDVEALRAKNPRLTLKAACETLKRTQRKTYAGQSVEALLARHRAWSRLIGLTRSDIDEETKKSLRTRKW
jgi:hypothetical protein